MPVEDLRDRGPAEVIAAADLIPAADCGGGLDSDGVLRVDRRPVIHVGDDKTVRGLRARSDRCSVDLRRAAIDGMVVGKEDAARGHFPKVRGRFRGDEIRSHSIPDDDYDAAGRKGVFGKAGDNGKEGEQE